MDEIFSPENFSRSDIIFDSKKFLTCFTDILRIFGTNNFQAKNRKYSLQLYHFSVVGNNIEAELGNKISQSEEGQLVGSLQESIALYMYCFARPHTSCLTVLHAAHNTRSGYR